MPQEKSKEVGLAQLLLDRALGRPDLAATPAPMDPTIPASWYPKGRRKMETPAMINRKPILLETPRLAPMDKQTRLFVRPGPEPTGPLVNPLTKLIAEKVQRMHPDAMRRVKTIHFQPREDGELGTFWGDIENSQISMDPNQKLDYAPDLMSSGVAALRHELAHAMQYDDNYNAQPQKFSTKGKLIYDRRPLSADGKPRDAQDVDLASILLDRHGKK
jgi:hypothetical protein